MEGLRLSPGLATRLARIAPDRELVYNDSVIPAGTPISMTVLLLRWNESVYPNARKSEPERWMDKERMRKGGEDVRAVFKRNENSSRHAVSYGPISFFFLSLLASL